jgi:23S rRNA (adenine1618-N6)-methyltransferase
MCRWIPDGQLCPAVTNRANYIHWIEDLLALAPAPWRSSAGAHLVAGVDIGTGANCIYPLLGASLHGWRFVGTGTVSLPACIMLLSNHVVVQMHGYND